MKSIATVVFGLFVGLSVGLISHQSRLLEGATGVVAFSPEQRFGVSILEFKDDKKSPFSLEVSNSGKDDVKLRYSIELVDDRGVSVQAPFISPAQTLVKLTKNTKKLKIEGVSDGYYSLVAKVAFVSDGVLVGEGGDEKHLSVEDGKMKVISNSDFDTFSLKNVAMKETEVSR